MKRVIDEAKKNGASREVIEGMEESLRNAQDVLEERFRTKMNNLCSPVSIATGSDLSPDRDEPEEILGTILKTTDEPEARRSAIPYNRTTYRS